MSQAKNRKVTLELEYGVTKGIPDERRDGVASLDVARRGLASGVGVEMQRNASLIPRP